MSGFSQGVGAVVRMFSGSPPRQWGKGGRSEFEELPGDDAPSEFYEAFDRINADVFNNELESIPIRVNTHKFNSGFCSWYGAPNAGVEFMGFWETFQNDPEYQFEQMARHMSYVSRRPPSPPQVELPPEPPQASRAVAELAPAPQPERGSPAVEALPATVTEVAAVAERPVSILAPAAPVAAPRFATLRAPEATLRALATVTAAPRLATLQAPEMPSVRWTEELAKPSRFIAPPVQRPAEGRGADMEALLMAVLAAVGDQKAGKPRTVATALRRPLDVIDVLALPVSDVVQARVAAVVSGQPALAGFLPAPGEAPCNFANPLRTATPVRRK